MKKIVLTIALGSIFLFNYCFASTYRNQTSQEIQDKYCWYLDDFAKKDGETSYHVHQQAPKRNGFQNQEPSFTSKSQTFGDTTYHNYDSPQPRKGFRN